MNQNDPQQHHDSHSDTQASMSQAETSSDSGPSRENPIVIASPDPKSDEKFDPSRLLELLGEPGKYESAILTTIEEIDEKQVIETSWGPAEADPEVDVVATPYIVNSEGDLVQSGKSYPLKKAELEKRSETDMRCPHGKVLLKKNGVTDFFRIPERFEGAIHVLSAEHKPGDTPQIAEKGDIIAFTDSGAWVMEWDENKFKEV